MNTKDFATSFPPITLFAINLFGWQKILSHTLVKTVYYYSLFKTNYYSNQTKHTPRVFLGGSRFATKGSTGEGFKPPHQKIESSLVPSCLTPSSHDCRLHIGKKLMISNSFYTYILKYAPPSHLSELPPSRGWPNLCHSMQRYQLPPRKLTLRPQ